MLNDELIKLIDDFRSLPRENEWLEFKTGSSTTPDKFGQYISGLSNAACIQNQNFGYLLFGIDDATHDVVGTNYNFRHRKKGNESFELWLRRMLTPSIRFEYFICNYNNLSKVEVFRIPAAVGEPTIFQNEAFIRISSSLTKLKNYPQFAREIYNSQKDWSALIIQKATIKHLNKNAILVAKEKYKIKQQGSSFYSEIDQWSDITFLDKIKVTIDGKITNTAILLFGKQESVHLISPAVAQITWKLETEESAYEHFSPPFFITINDVLKRIRNINFKFFPNNQLIATEVIKYDPEVILEAINNCIAHQNYAHNARIVLIEKIDRLIFKSSGSFFDGHADDYSIGLKTPTKYRNKWLVEAMVNLGMIDSLGFGIYKMFKSQRNRFFPLPDYSNSSLSEVRLEIFGNTIDENYSKLLIERKENLDLTEVILLDKVQKGLGKSLTDQAIKKLRKKKLIEGRKPNFFISESIANITGQKVSYTRNKGLNKSVYQHLILQHIKNHGDATRMEIDELLFDHLPEYLTEKQKKKKIENLLQSMKGDTIKNVGSRIRSKWILIDDTL